MGARRLLVLMGPSGCGKSTIGRIVADRVGVPFVEGDDFHPRENIRKMASGRALSDADREAWLDALLAVVRNHVSVRLILACSALTPYVQGRLRAESGRAVTFVVLEVGRDELLRRLEQRDRHFMPASLADSQLAALEVPGDAHRVKAQDDPRAIVHRLAELLEHCCDGEHDAEAGQADEGRG